jgi:hypothetical protein
MASPIKKATTVIIHLAKKSLCIQGLFLAASRAETSNMMLAFTVHSATSHQCQESSDNEQ